MKLDLTRYRQPVGHFVRTFQPEEVGGESDAYLVVTPVELEFDILKDKDRFRLVGHVRTELELTCSRCVEPYRFAIDADFDHRYLPSSEASTEQDREVAEEDLETSYYADDQIDLGELMREQFYLALPMKPLCSEDCKGLCAQCGTNLNTGTCDCAPVWEDPRLAALKQLKQ
ncbi:MAG TPA: DUF177 domain-containing protein [Vicinamibacterales bacterium]|jgi:uncharacterized protein|nr:DUF177 domain-containing protein [Vicinamibacterales bacterium]